MTKTILLAVVATLTVLLSVATPKAEADVGISIGIPLPGVAFYAPVAPPPVYYVAPPYYPPAYYAPPGYYGPSYGTVYSGGYGGGWGHYYGRRGGHRHGRGCHHAKHW